MMPVHVAQRQENKSQTYKAQNSRSKHMAAELEAALIGDHRSTKVQVHLFIPLRFLSERISKL